jgi:hypothetical protein
MTDYTNIELGKPFKKGHSGHGIICPVCGEKGLLVDDYVNPQSGDKKKQRFCLHSDDPVSQKVEQNGITTEITNVVEIKHLIPDSWIDAQQNSQS